MKVYCNDCRYIYAHFPMTNYRCDASGNTERKKNWLGIKYRLLRPKEINKNNDCKWYRNKLTN